MPLYEHTFMVRQDLSNAQVDALTEQFKSVIEAGGGSVAKTEYWGVKPLTYRIKKNRKAHFTLFNLDTPPAAVAEMERQMALSEDVIRFLTIKVDELEDGPSAMMRRGRDRDDRGGRDDRFGRGRGDRGDRGERNRPPREDSKSEGGDRGERSRPPREDAKSEGGE
jgi:small subunit ribosomal protein S6